MRSLYGLAALPKKSDHVTAVIEKTVGFLLDPQYSLAEGVYPASNTVSKHWANLNFPLFYQADVLFTLRVLGELGALGRPAAKPALDWLESKRQPNGRWKGTSPFKPRTWAIVAIRRTRIGGCRCKRR